MRADPGGVSKISLGFYFDGQARIFADQQRSAGRHGDWTDLRRIACRLPEDSYKAAILAIRGILTVAGGQQNPDNGPKQQSCQESTAAREEAYSGLYALSKQTPGRQAAPRVDKVHRI